MHRLSKHARQQCQIRRINSDLILQLLRGVEPTPQEICVIVHKAKQIYHREGSSGDLVVAACQNGIVKTVMLQHSWQVKNRGERLGKKYLDLTQK